MRTFFFVVVVRINDRDLYFNRNIFVEIDGNFIVEFLFFGDFMKMFHHGKNILRVSYFTQNLLKINSCYDYVGQVFETDL